MPKQIKKLTVAQAAQMLAWRDKWIATGLSTAAMTDADRSKVEAAIRALYVGVGKPEPKVVIFVPSPMVLALAAGIAAGAIHAHRNGFPGKKAVRSAVRSAVGSAVDSAVRSAVDSAVGSAVDSAVRSAVGSAVDSAVRSAVRSAVDSAVGSAVDSAVRSAVDSAVGSAVRSAVDSAVDSAREPDVRFLLECARAVGTGYGWRWNWWAGWSAYCSFFRDVCALEIPEPGWNLFGHFETTQMACGPYYIHDDFAMVSDRPEVLRRDAGGRLHADDGMAIRWRDGTGFAFWHGLRVPETHTWIVIDRARLTPEAIEGEANAELRRVMLEAFGFDRYLGERKARLIDHDELHGQPRDLYEIRLKDDAVRVVRVVNGSLEPDGTRRVFVLGAARRANQQARPRNCHEAIAASYGINPNAYREAVRS